MNSYSETFSIPKHLIGLALGEKGSNKLRAQTLKGIKTINFNQKSRAFTIIGYNEEIVKIVRSLLEYGEWEQPVARNLSDFLQHANGTLIQNIIHASGLVRAEVLDDEMVDKKLEKQSEYVGLKFVGTMFSINEAKSRLKTLMNSSEYSDFQAAKEAMKKPQYQFAEHFKVSSHLVGLAIGKNGSRIEEARKLSGIVEIKQQDADGFSIFDVYSNNYDSVKKARQMLEMAEEKMLVPPNKVGLIIGTKGSSIKDIIRKTKVYKIEVLEKEPTETGDIPVQLVGNPDHIEAAKMCIESKFLSSK